MNKGIEENIINFRLEAARDAQKMSRLAFLVLCIVSLAVILATWNAYFSWYTNFALKEEMPNNDVTKLVHTEVIEQWVESANISLPFLGIKVGVGDFSVFSSIGLLILTILFLLCIRREYYVIRSLLNNVRDSSEWNPGSREWIYHGIVSFMLFISIKWVKRAGKKFRPRSMIHAIFVVLVFLPAIAIFFLIVSDIMTVFVMKACYRFPHTPLIDMHLASGDLFKIVLMELLATILLAIIIILCTKVLNYVERTAERLREYAQKYNIEVY
jgi:hypothetical protein